jgi:MSHA biogenesis protein MshK
VATSEAAAAPAKAAAAPTSATTIPSPAPAANSLAANADKPAQAGFRLKGIIYTTRPLAIINGKTVTLGDHVDGATVFAIGASSVTLLINGEHKTLQLR